MNAVASVGPIAISVDATGWGAYESGVYKVWNQNAPVINHAVVLGMSHIFILIFTLSNMSSYTHAYVT